MNSRPLKVSGPCATSQSLLEVIERVAEHV
jgi:hypothetical protein